ncbi:hypothetical protein HZA44_02340, partial [Candidatus Peregrinibacteria bacterium]|nr:hypothetical protein [Candidatus Peregrinibacteria bacterium]
PQPAKAVTNLETEDGCNTHPAYALGQKLKTGGNNQLLPCCFETKNENGQIGSFAGLVNLKLLQLSEMLGTALLAYDGNASSYFFSVPAPPPELSLLSSIIIRV